MKPPAADTVWSLLKASRLESIAIAPWFESLWLLRVGRLTGREIVKTVRAIQAANPQKPGDLKQGSDSYVFLSGVCGSHDGVFLSDHRTAVTRNIY